MRGLRELTRLPFNGCDRSRIDWKRLRQLSRRTARETKVARETHSVTVQTVRTREVRGGFLNLAKRTESYGAPEISPMSDDDALLDFEAKYYSFDDGISVATDRDPDKRRPKGDVKGAGLTSALTRLLTGR
ncbi:hypothetical protein [Lentzea flaviverrucosa]|uniref:hypothetical protein n=1 Tax=Lentzea flaviverrucosa TaxID=200379 RepID=UPI000B7DB229|nr:hypothetical protein [Lentzea flaviverrucosa]